MTIILKNPNLYAVIEMIIRLAAPSNIKYLWNFGSLVGICLVVQILTGVFLALQSVEHIIPDSNCFLAIAVSLNSTILLIIYCILVLFRGTCITLSELLSSVWAALLEFAEWVTSTLLIHIATMSWTILIVVEKVFAIIQTILPQPRVPNPMVRKYVQMIIDHQTTLSADHLLELEQQILRLHVPEADIFVDTFIRSYFNEKTYPLTLKEYHISLGAYWPTSHFMKQTSFFRFKSVIKATTRQAFVWITKIHSRTMTTFSNSAIKSSWVESPKFTISEDMSDFHNYIIEHGNAEYKSNIQSQLIKDYTHFTENMKDDTLYDLVMHFNISVPAIVTDSNFAYSRHPITIAPAIKITKGTDPRTIADFIYTRLLMLVDDYDATLVLGYTFLYKEVAQPDQITNPAALVNVTNNNVRENKPLHSKSGPSMLEQAYTPSTRFLAGVYFDQYGTILPDTDPIVMQAKQAFPNDTISVSKSTFQLNKHSDPQPMYLLVKHNTPVTVVDQPLPYLNRTVQNECFLYTEQAIISSPSPFDVKDNVPLFKWKDWRTNVPGQWVRELKNKSIVYQNPVHRITQVITMYNFPSIQAPKPGDSSDRMLATLDIETYNNEEGHQEAYAIGWFAGSAPRTYYIDQYRTSDNMIKVAIADIFHAFTTNVARPNRKVKNLCTVYVHNLGRFDSMFIIKALIDTRLYTLKPTFKGTSLLTLILVRKSDMKTITIADSYYLLPKSLRTLAMSFNCSVLKGHFPHLFFQGKGPHNFNYIGPTPSLQQYGAIDAKVYQELYTQNWDCKQQCLEYLEGDLISLYQVVEKFAQSIWEDYQVNITTVKTLPALAFKIFTLKFLSLSDRLSLVVPTGEVEANIRSAYTGGLSYQAARVTQNSFAYDQNSQFPAAMMNYMPVGNPVHITNPTLDTIFGFVYGTITAPTPDVLRIPYIQARLTSGGVVVPRGKFKRWIFSEEIKAALLDGYTFEIEQAYAFSRSDTLFKNYVNHFYEIKKNPKSSVHREIAKLMLNSLYGRMGMRPITERSLILPTNLLSFLRKFFNVKQDIPLSEEYSYVSLSGPVDPSLVALYKDKTIPHELRKQIKGYVYNQTLECFEHHPYNNASPHVAAAITSYARACIRPFLNMPSNPLQYLAVDGVHLPHPLDSSHIGQELGQMKLEHTISHAIYIRPKLYALYCPTESKPFIIKSSSVPPANLTWTHFQTLLTGQSVTVPVQRWRLDWKTLRLTIYDTTMTIQPNLIDVGAPLFVTTNSLGHTVLDMEKTTPATLSLTHALSPDSEEYQLSIFDDLPTSTLDD